MTNTNTLTRVRPISHTERDNIRLSGWDYVIDVGEETYPISISTMPADSGEVILSATFTPTGDLIHVVYTPDFDIYRMLLK